MSAAGTKEVLDGLISPQPKATHLGFMPGNDFIAAADVVLSETGDLPVIPILPQRGIRGQIEASTMRLLPELPIEIGPRSWRLSARPHIVTHRLWDDQQRDFDQLEEAWGTLHAVGIAVLGPLSLATRIELANGHRAISDPGAVNDINEIFIGNLQEKFTYLHRIFGAQPHVIIQEPELDAIMTGSIKATTDFDHIHPMRNATERLHHTVAALSMSATCHMFSPLASLKTISAHVSIVSPHDYLSVKDKDNLAQLLAQKKQLGIQIAGLTKPRESAVFLAQLWDELGFPRTNLLHHIIYPRWQLDQFNLLEAAQVLAHAQKIAEILEKDVGDL
ncbi:Uncharacterised protein [Corynebacterium kutscheri]|uniref:Methionine synthase II (Cobalamin-independent) n=1 Tax=Corynebacterium kutscheri TaxID=35755 RepID=A0A0F6TDK8_9CORY|nr:hypothetical protein [Corynebacterium kutscheri]AKE40999.1 hypothetical protein UL82_03970 [Corynebacterium kutscheri]VEH06884.1 Uncharacterised protein [Corynebacterium kutscheri]VEH09297.1 Uncharacterised protein [Corynebacterium kutscheri]VEH79385.1 Uncharacterised protein [Corynebacterium kutscheri]